MIRTFTHISHWVHVVVCSTHDTHVVIVGIFTGGGAAYGLSCVGIKQVCCKNMHNYIIIYICKMEEGLMSFDLTYGLLSYGPTLTY